MADENIQRMLVQIEATTAGLRRELDKGENSVKRFSDNADKSAKGVGFSFEGMARSAAKMAAPLLGAVSAMEALGKAIEVQRQFDKLNAGLITATGSSEKAAIAFGALQEFAAKTPYSLDQAVEGFSKLVNLGLTPSEKALTSYGNTAAAMGKDLNQMIEAVADAATGEFERLKEFGITSSQQGDKVSLTFRGVTTTIGKSAKEIEGYLMNLGLVDFAGAMDERAKTLDGQISNLGDTWDQTFRLINEKGLGDLMRDAVSTAADALQELNESLDSGQFESYLEAVGDKFDGFGGDIKNLLNLLNEQFGEFFAYFGKGAVEAGQILVDAFKDFPENVRAIIQIMVTEVLAGFDKVKAYSVAFKDALAATFSDTTYKEVSQNLEQALGRIDSVREGSIEGILAERDAAIGSYKDQTAAADERLRKYREERAESAKSSEDRLAQFSKQTEAAKSLSKEEENKAKQQAKALADLLAQSKISTDAANALADAYLNGQDQLAKFTLQEKISQELLKTGAAARDKVTAAIEGQLNAEARRDVAKATYDLRAETSALDLQAAATLQGTSALEAFNVERAKSAILAGKNVDALTEETRQYLEAFEANQKANKALQQAGEVDGIMDRLQPQAKLLKDYTKEVDALTDAMERNPDKADQYRETLRLLGLEYEQNRAKATAWGQFTEGAVDRVDEAFADAWRNIGSGFSGFANSLKDGFKQLLAELAHLAITKPIIMQIGAAMGVGGLSASQNSGGIGNMLSSLSGNGGGNNIGNLLSYGQSAYKFLSGTGSELYSAFQSGGMQGVYNYGANAVGSMFGSASANTASIGASQAGYTGTQFSNWSAAQSAGSATWGGAASSIGAIGAGITGAYAGYQNAGWKGAIAGGVGGWGGATLGTMAGAAAAAALSGTAIGATLGSIIPGIGTIIGAALGAAFGSKLFGGAWETKDTGLALGVSGGDLDANSYQFQKKKGGMFSKNKKRTLYGALPDEQAALLQGTYDTTESAVEELFTRLGVSMNDGVLDGLNVGRTQISTEGKTDEQIQEEITKWFAGVADSMTSAIDAATGAGIGYNFEDLRTFVNNLYSVNDAIRYLNVGLYDASVAGGQLAESLSATAGGLQALQQSTATYFDQFFSDTEKANATLDTVTRAFKSADTVLPDTREGFRKAVEALDLTTDAGQAMFTTLMALAGQADSYYDILEQRSASLAQTLAQAQSAMLDGALGNLQRAIQRQQTSLTDAYNAQVEGLNSSLTASQSVMSSMTSMANGLASALKTLQGQSDAAKAVLYQQAQATLVSAAAIARAGGSLAGLAGIDDALSAVTNNDAGRYANWEDFARDQGRSLVLIDELNSAAGGQLDQAQASVKALQDQIALAKKQYDMESTKLQGQLDLAQAQIDGINGIDTRLLSVNEALAEILAAITKASPNGTGATNADAIIEAAYRAALGRSADAAGAAYWKQQLASGAVNSNNLSTAIGAAGAANAAAAPSQIAAAYASTLGRMPTEADMAYWTAQMASGAVTDIGAAIKASAVANGQIPAFASGGSYMGGLALVGERGPEVIDFNRPGYVYNARETAEMLSGADLSGVMGLLAQLLAAVGEGNDHLWFINDRTRATADNTEVLRDQALKEATV